MQHGESRMIRFFWFAILDRCPDCHTRLYHWSADVAYCQTCNCKY